MVKTDPRNRPAKVDMSPEAIDRRLRKLAQLYRLGRSLSQAQRVGKVRELQGR